MSNGIFGDLFDFNGDENLDCFEQGLEFMFLAELTSDDDCDDFDSDEFDDWIVLGIHNDKGWNIKLLSLYC